MGGTGSGTWYRWDKKTYADEYKSIDIRWLKKRGLLVPNRSGSLSWSTNGEPTGNIRYSMWTNSIQLIYRYRQYGDDWESVNEYIHFEETGCNLGGSRKWFVCPSCRTRVAVLYGPGKYFRCRKCYGLSYASQSEGKLDRLCRKARKIRHKLDIDSEWWNPDALGEPIFMKPKGMRWHTFERLKQAENGYQREIEKLMVYRFGNGWY